MTTPRWRRLVGAVGFLTLHRAFPSRTLLFGPLSFGDDVLCTTVLREARLRGRPFAMMTNHPELFAGNHDPSAILPINNDAAAILRRFGRTVVQPYYATPDPTNRHRDILPDRHILAEMCALAGLTGSVALRPWFRSQPTPRTDGRVVIQSSTLSAAVPLPTKQWDVRRLEETVAASPRGLKFAQVGSQNDPGVQGAEDLRGRTSLSETIRLLAGSDVFVGPEGFLAHLARAVDCPAVVIYGGRSLPRITGYPCNENIVAHPPCAPCGLNSGCPHDMACMEAITSKEVVAALVRVLDCKATPPLPHDCAEISNSR